MSEFNKVHFKFGIHALDEKLIRRDADDSQQPSLWSAAIVGPDGTGKSILAMHIASNYLREHAARYGTAEKPPYVFYVSTDLSATIAESTLSHFGLCYPSLRSRILRRAYKRFASAERIRRYLQTSKQLDYKEIEFETIRPSEARSEELLLKLKQLRKRKPTIYFVDLQADSAGDDWYFVNQLLGLFPGTDEAPSLVVVDAVEGLEAFVGDLDTFGEVRSRRSRIAQLSRMCTKAKSNSVFVVERDDDDHREPEQFIVDYVITLRTRTEQEFVKRTVEIEKFRGCWHARGEHELTIRQGKGAFTGNVANLDEPPIPWTIEKPNSKKKYERYLSHMLVIPSLHFVNREFREKNRALEDPQGRPEFGLKLLDNLLGDVSKPLDGEGSITLLLGDAGTHKGRLARRFLSKGLEDPDGIAILISTGLIDKAGLKNRLSEHVPESNQLLECFDDLRQKQFEMVNDRQSNILCRRLSVRHLTSAHLLLIIDTQLRWAKALSKRRNKAIKGNAYGHIRVVIDDWNNIVETHPNIARDPLFLQTLIANLKRGGVSALIVSTQPEQPFVETQELSRFDLRKIDEQHIYTWSTSFFGERRTAITCLNDRRGPYQPTVLELRPLELAQSQRSAEAISIGRDFALYQGIENGAAIRVPLEIRLVSIEDPTTSSSVSRYANMINETFTRVFASTDQVQVVHFDSLADYDRTATFSEWMDDTRLGRTLVMQIDEFWKLGGRKSHRQSLMDLSGYWNEEVIGEYDTEEKKMRSVRSQADTYGVWQTMEKPETTDTSSITAKYWKQVVERKEPGVATRNLYRVDMVDDEIRVCSPTDRIPYLWDFGFLLADKTLWKMHANEEVQDSYQRPSIREVWNSLCVEGDWLDAVKPNQGQRGNVSWLDFFAATRQIASFSDANAMNTDLLTIETICSLLLEIWGSIAIQKDNHPENFSELTVRCPASSAASLPNVPLGKLLKENRESLKIATVLLLYGFPQLTSEQDRRICSRSENRRFVASREWYSTAVHRLRKEGSEGGRYSYLALPGSFTTRGDWFLSVASGSRSQLLAERSIDLLTSRRMGLIRLHAGLGLPVRDIVRGNEIDALGTALPRFDALERDDTGAIKTDMNSKSLSYGDLKSLGAKQDVRSWLWRSRIKDYDRDCFYFQRWIGRVLFERDIWFSSTGQYKLIELFPSDLNNPTLGSNANQFSEAHLEYTIKILESALRSHN